MSLSSAIHAATSSLRVLQATAQIASNNIANAQNPVYSRKQVNLTTRIVQGGPTGLEVSSISRSVADNVLRDLFELAASKGAADVRAGYTTRLSELLDAKSGEPKLTQLLSRFESAWRDWEGTPENSGLRQIVVSRGNELTTEIRRLYAETVRFDTAIRRDIGIEVASINEALKEVHDLNRQIAAYSLDKQPIGDLEDRRDAALRKLSEHVEIRTYEAADHQVRVFTRAGLQLLELEPNSFVFDGVNIIESNGPPTPLNNMFSGGRIGGLVQMQDASLATSTDPMQGTIERLRDQLNLFAINLRDVINNAYDPLGAQAGELASGVVTTPGAPPADEASVVTMNAALISGAQVLKVASPGAVSQALSSSTFSVNSAGLSLSSVTVGDLLGGIMGHAARSAADAQNDTVTADAVHHALDQRYRGLTGVDLDAEVAFLTVIQNSYAASARVLDVLRQMFDIVVSLGR